MTVNIGNNPETYLTVAILLALFAVIVYSIVRTQILAKKDNDRMLEELDTEEEPPLEEIVCCVRTKYCGISVSGGKVPTVGEDFCAVFVAEDGREFELAVEEEVYLSLEEGQKGTLAVVNGNFYGFCPDENE